MIDYLASFTNTDGSAYPDTAFVNSTGPSTTDGTEFVKLFGDDIWGARQAIMNYAGLIPDGVTEADGTAQIIEALQKGFGGSPGFVMEWNLAADPATTGHRALLLQGQGLLRASYVDLDSAVYVGDGNNAAVAAAGGGWYRADDAAGVTPNIAGLYLILPESRGVVPRGLDTAASIDPDGASRYVGDLQIDSFQGFDPVSATAFGLQLGGAGATTFYNAGGGTTGTNFPWDATDGSSDSDALGRGYIVADGVNGTPRISTETRMYNRSTRFVVWY